MAKLLKAEVEHWLEKGNGTFWFIEREDGFDVFLTEPPHLVKIKEGKTIDLGEDPRYRKVTR